MWSFKSDENQQFGRDFCVSQTNPDLWRVTSEYHSVEYSSLHIQRYNRLNKHPQMLQFDDEKASEHPAEMQKLNIW